MLVPTPRPLHSCPGLLHWKRYAGRPYLVFVDESFRGFFEFDKRGYFVHGAFGIPEEEYASLKLAVAPLLDEYRALTSASATEFKHSEFKRIPYCARRRLAYRLRDEFRSRGAFVGGFYSPLESFVLERVRTNEFFEDGTSIPDDVRVAYAKAEDELRAETNDQVGQAKTIGKLINLPVVAVANMLATFGCHFTVIYDPRERKEDRAVASLVDEYLKVIEGLTGIEGDIRADLRSFVTAFIHDRRSEDELGLQMADLVAGEVREFFVAFPELLTEGSSPRLITPTSVEPRMTVTVINDIAFKTGCLTAMRPSLRGAFFHQDPSRRTLLSAWREYLLSGILTCYAKYGTPRDLMPFEQLIWDQVE